MIYEAFLSSWLLDKHLHERRLRELREVKMADTPLNAVQEQIQTYFLKLSESAIAQYFNDIQATKSDALMTFTNQLKMLKKARDDAKAAAASPTPKPA